MWRSSDGVHADGAGEAIELTVVTGIIDDLANDATAGSQELRAERATRPALVECCDRLDRQLSQGGDREA